MLDYILDLFSAAQFVPHGMCPLWRPDLLIMHGLSDLMIAAAYFSIPVIIIRVVRARPDLIEPKIARLFALFITACGLSHAAALLTLWVPAYGLQGVIKVVTAAVSVYTAIQLVRLLSTFLTLPSRETIARMEAEVEFEQQRKQELQEARDKLSEFAYIAAHDLKAPMRGLANQAQFLIEDHGEGLAPDAHRRLTRIQELCGQLENLVSTLLAYSRIGRAEARQQVDTGLIVKDVKASLAEVLEEKNGQIVVETAMPAVHANPADVATVLQNLIVNGLTYNDSEEKRISIGFKPEADVNGTTMHSVFYVRDNGIGIEPEFHKDVFKMFKRLNQPEAYGSGTGAGLAFVQQVIESNDGQIALVSEPGKGSTFYVSFPERHAGESRAPVVQVATA